MTKKAARLAFQVLKKKESACKGKIRQLNKEMDKYRLMFANVLNLSNMQWRQLIQQPGRLRALHEALVDHAKVLDSCAAVLRAAEPRASP